MTTRPTTPTSRHFASGGELSHLSLVRPRVHSFGRKRRSEFSSFLLTHFLERRRRASTFVDILAATSPGFPAIRF